MPKVITISDKVYEELSRLKGDKSFSEIINELVTFYNESKRGRKGVLLEIFGILTKEEAEELEREVERTRKEFQIRDFHDP
jgi:Uncharacterized ACR, COG1753.